MAVTPVLKDNMFRQVAIVDASGNPVAGASAYTTPTHTAPVIGAASVSALAANASRKYALFVNDSDTVIYLALGGAAALNTGIRINPGGGSYEMSGPLGSLYTGAIFAISSAASKVLLVTEGV